MRRLHRTLVLALGAALLGCHGPLRLAPDDSDAVLARHLIRAPDPGERGPHAVRRLYYGSGTDRRRAVYRDSVAFRTATVDGSKLLDLGRSARERNGYWGFGPDSLPLNARVWYPDGPGPFPLVLVVHGNHDMKDFSDPGYEYLGELLASRGHILASVDMNFLNGRIRGENDARGWMLLQHLRAWRAFHADPENPFHGKVDLSRIALIGHSRGGEAVAHAAAFNRLERYPDDASLEFDFGFDIRSIVAIAPVDGQYRPADRLVPVRDVSYLVFHGSHDGDVSGFMGLRPYQRVAFTPGTPHFKAAVYVYRANHGQWNTVWGPNDSGDRSSRILDLRGLLDPRDQRRFAEVYVSAFLEATLRADDRYLPLFRDHRVAGGWLPKTMYITRFEESGFRALADFEEDIDVTSGTAPGVALRGDSLATWKEGGLRLRIGNSPEEGSSMENHAVRLGWNRRIAGRDSTELGRPAVYTLALPGSLAGDWRLGEGSWLQFLLMPTDEVPGPRKEKEQEGSAEERKSGGRGDGGKEGERRDLPPIDLSVELVDAEGRAGRVALSGYGAIRRPLEIDIMRRDDHEERFAFRHEFVLQTFTIPLADFREAAPGLDLARLAEVRFVFDRAPAGTVILDEVGFASPVRPFLPPGR